MLPNGWKEVKLGECFDIQLGKMLNESARKQEPQFPYIANVNVRWGALDLSTLSSMFFSEREKEKFALKKNDILMCEGGEIGRCVVLKEDVQDVYYQKACHRLRTKNNLCDPWYLYFYMSYIVKSAKIIGLVGESSIAHLPVEKVEKILLTLPPLAEQKKIAETLSVWDSAIEKMEKLVALQNRRFQQMLKKHIVEKNDDGVWDTCRIGDLFDAVTRKNKENCKNVLTSSAQLGLVNQQEYYKKSVSALDVTGYYLLKKGEFAYNRSSSTGYPFGVVKRLDRYETGVLSTLYLCMGIKNEKKCYSDFFVYLFESGCLEKQLSLICREGARNHGLLNVSKEDFFNMSVPVPSLNEQKRIAEFLLANEKELSLLKQQLALYKKQKQGLMQKLLTGEWRV